MIGIGKRKATGLVAFLIAGIIAAGATSLLTSKAPGQGPPTPKQISSYLKPASDDVADWPAGWPDLTNPPDENPKTKVILKALDEPIAMNFATETPLSDVIKYIQDSTQSPELPKGIIIYVDPLGLQDADKTEADTVRINLENVPLKTTLNLVLKQLSLDYRVKDGLMIISSKASDDFVTPFSIMEEKARLGVLSREQYRQLIEALKLRKQVETLVNGQE
jgi:hypothetical protein